MDNPQGWGASCHIRTLPGIADDEAAEHCSDSSSWAGHTHCGSPGADELGGSVDVPRDCTGLEGACQDCRLADGQQSLKGKKPLQLRSHVVLSHIHSDIIPLNWCRCRHLNWHHPQSMDKNFALRCTTVNLTRDLQTLNWHSGKNYCILVETATSY